MEVNMNERDRLLRRIRADDFALYEAVLYLDGHPRNKKALEYYRQLRDELAQLKAEYTRKYGPLTIYDNDNGDSWQWIDGPWPWEREGN